MSYARARNGEIVDSPMEYVTVEIRERKLAMKTRFQAGNPCNVCNEDHGEHVLLSREEKDLFIKQGCTVVECSVEPYPGGVYDTGTVYGVVYPPPDCPADADFMREISS